MKFIKLLTTAHVNGVMRHPHEGALHLDDAEADRLVDANAGEDVSDDFTAKDDKAVPVESLTTDDGKTPAPVGGEPHKPQSEIPPAPVKAAASTKEPKK